MCYILHKPMFMMIYIHSESKDKINNHVLVMSSRYATAIRCVSRSFRLSGTSAVKLTEKQVEISFLSPFPNSRRELNKNRNKKRNKFDQFRVQAVAV